MTNSLTLTNIPGVPESFVREGTDSNGYFYQTTPHIIKKPCTLFQNTKINKILQEEFGTVYVNYIKNPPNSLYDWHRDIKRLWSLNWIVKADISAKAFFRHNNIHKLFWDLEEINYSKDHPTILDTQQEHCVINSHNEERIILSLWCPVDLSYSQACDYFSSLRLAHDEYFSEVS